MKLCIFGATGKTGRLIVEQALEHQHDVTAFVRDPSKLSGEATDMQLVQGDVSDRAAIERAITGSEAVISALGSGKNTLTTFGKFAVPIMQQAGVSRIVSLVGAGVSVDGDYPSFGRSLMLGLMNLIAKDVLQDAERHASLLRKSDREWTLVRPPRLADGPATGRIEHAEHLKLGPSRSITRADLAGFMLEVATRAQYVHQAPMVANLPAK